MKPNIGKALLTLAIALSAGTTVAAAQPAGRLPSTDSVVAEMMQHNAVRQSQMTGYTVLRRYVAINRKRRAEMLVRVACDRNGAEHFSILSEEGSRSIRHHVFPRLLKDESNTSRGGMRRSIRLTPANYRFRIIGEAPIETGPAYVIAVSPKSASRYSIEGRIWVDASDYAIVRVEGRPARRPSFWVRSAHFVRTYQKVGQFWLASSTRTRSRIWIFGDSELNIESFNYQLVPPVDFATEADNRASVIP